jgi:hypothetical protein
MRFDDYDLMRLPTAADNNLSSVDKVE